ncbi:GntR family transcriptional regulator [Salipiger sp. P9]|uniref:GntR family transcriptional regulator n=1 Tax=Salipiger pentaromativorans TaxID=2943193 RepID=UPI002157795A|nr:GntR family transcriptional regulator [Salipiger pentaromativorans]MCR8546365.1 GntR family transcriptional regulator [Salipiger pentaromativorans]
MDQQNDNDGFAPLDREGLVQRVARRLSKAIVTGQLAPGARLSESVVARQLGVSRAPVREAARLLENSGLITYLPNRGFFVRSISARELEDLYELRLVIETAAVRRLIRNGLGAAEAQLAAQIDELHRVAGPDFDMLTQVEADMEFHRLLCAASGNPKFLAVFQQIATETELSIMLIGRLYDDAHRLAETHEPILAALRAGDEARAVEAIRYHIDVARAVVTEQFRKLEGDLSE